MSKNINPSLVLVQPRKTHPYITERLLMRCKESNQTKKQTLDQPIEIATDPKLFVAINEDFFYCISLRMDCHNFAHFPFYNT